MDRVTKGKWALFTSMPAAAVCVCVCVASRDDGHDGFATRHEAQAGDEHCKFSFCPVSGLRFATPCLFALCSSGGAHTLGVYVSKVILNNNNFSSPEPDEGRPSIVGMRSQLRKQYHYCVPSKWCKSQDGRRAVSLVGTHLLGPTKGRAPL